MSVRYRLLKFVFDWYVDLSMGLFSRYPIGTNVFERDWDMLILLDTCRVDALKEVSSRYDFIDDVGSIVSVGSTSSEWIANTFVEEYSDEIANTVYVSANAYADWVLEGREFPDGRYVDLSDWRTVSGDAFLALDQPWKYAPDPEHGYVRPRFVTDRAIANAREHDPDRLIVHYNQPHEPYTATADADGRSDLYEYEKDPFGYLSGGGNLQTVWRAYLKTLRAVLDDVALLLDNVDAETVVISADHGEAFGEYGVYGHHVALPHPKLKLVPWVETEATDNRTYEPKMAPAEEMRAAEEQLEDLGYL